MTRHSTTPLKASARHRPGFAVCLLAAAVVLSGCGGDEGGDSNTVGATGSAFPSCYEREQISGSSVAEFECGWAHFALGLQRRLDVTAPMRETWWIASHNSYNSSAYITGPSGNLDPNQSLTMREQLRLGMQSLELDIHWFEHAGSGGTRQPILCHGLGASQGHVGCSPLDQHLREGLAEIEAWIREPENAERVLIIDIENHLADAFGGANETAHELTIQAFDDILGDLVFRPPNDGACHKKPMDLTKARILAAGKQILLTGGCGVSDRWPRWVFDLGGVRHQKANDGYAGYPDCESESFSEADYREDWVRVWEDTTELGAQTNPGLERIDGETLIEMAKCGLNIPSLDRVRPDDPRYPAMIWSWAPTEPAPSDTLNCASHRADAHMVAADCGEAMRYACLDASAREWTITTAAGRWSRGVAACESETQDAAAFAVPRSGRMSQRLVEAKEAAGAERVWVHYDDRGRDGDWQAGAISR